MLMTILSLCSCSHPTNSVPSSSSSKPSTSSSDKTSLISKDTTSSNQKPSSGSFKPTDDVIVPKELTVDNLYSDLLSLASKGNFTVEYENGIQDIYQENYILLSSQDICYFKGNTIYQEVPVGVYKTKKIFDDNTGEVRFEICHLMEGEDEEGFSTGLPLEDFHTINKFSYLTNSNYGASKDDLKLSSDKKEITVDYTEDSNNRMFSILALMANNRNNVMLGKVNHISIHYDKNNDIVMEFSLVQGGSTTYPETYSSMTIKNISSSSDPDADEYLKTLNGSVGNTTFTYDSSLTLRNHYLSSNTTITAGFLDGSKDQSIGTYQLDYNPNQMHLKNPDGSESFYRRTESGEAYLQGVNALNQVYDEEYYAQSFARLGFGYDSFDFEGFRYDKDTDSYRYYGLNGGPSLESISKTGLTLMEFDSIQAYVEDGYINKIVAVTAPSLTQVSETEYKDVYYTITIDIVDYRTIGQPSIYSVSKDSAKIQKVFDMVNDYENTTLKTVSTEWYDKNDTKSLVPVVTSYYTKDVVYHETSVKKKHGNAYVTTKTGKGVYLIRDDQGNPIGTKNFRVKEDGTVEPRSQIQYGKTLKDEWINLSASPLVYELNGNILSPRSQMNGNKLKDYMPISHTRFEAQEGSMANGGDYSGMTFDLVKDGDTITDDIKTFHYYYGAITAFEQTPSGIGTVDFTYGTDDDPIEVSQDLLSKLKTLGTFTIPTKWSESVSSNIYTKMQEFFQGKKNRYGEEVDVDKDIPYLFDDDLDESWLYLNTGSLKNTKVFQIYHNVEDIINDGDINNYNKRYEALLKNNPDYTYTDSSTNPNFPGPFYYVNGDIVIGMTNNAYGGIYFYTAVPDYSD